MRKIALLGSGAFAEQVIDFCKDIDDVQVVGLFDGNKEVGTVINGYPVLGNDDDVERAYNNGDFDSVFICIGYNNFDLREKVYFRFIGKVPMISLVHPTAIINSSAVIGANVLVSEGSIVCKDVVIEDNVTIEAGVLIGHNNHIEKHCFLAGRVALAGNVSVGEKCFLGVNCSIRDGVSIGHDVTVGIGCVVMKDISDYNVVLGNPQKSIGSRK